jgi:hypothetical protein
MARLRACMPGSLMGGKDEDGRTAAQLARGRPGEVLALAPRGSDVAMAISEAGPPCRYLIKSRRPTSAPPSQGRETSGQDERGPTLKAS